MQSEDMAPGLDELHDEIVRRRREGLRYAFKAEEFTDDVVFSMDMDAWKKEEMDKWLSVVKIRVPD
jgi:hypothetical protein